MDNFDIKEKINEVVEKIKSDDNLAEEFKANPVKALEKTLGVDLPDDRINALIAGIKAKLEASDISEKLGKIGGLFLK